MSAKPGTRQLHRTTLFILSSLLISSAGLPAAAQPGPGQRGPGQPGLSPSILEAREELIRMEAESRLERVEQFLGRMGSRPPAAAEGRDAANALLAELGRSGFGAMAGAGRAEVASPGAGFGGPAALRAFEGEIERLETLAELLAAGPAKAENRVVAPAGAVRGRLTAPHGEPVPGAQVIAYDDAGRFAGLALSDEDGRYLLVPTRPGRVSLRVRAKGLLDVATGRAPCEAACLQVSREPLVAKQAVVSRNFGLASGLSVSGTITDGDSGDPLPNIYVTAVTGSNGYLGYALSDVDGHYEITGLSAGDIYVRTGSGAPYVDEIYDDVPCIGGRCYPLSVGQAIPLVDGQPAPVIDFALDLGGRIGGIVTDEATSDPIDQATVSFLDLDGNYLRAYQYTLAGEYSSDALPAGSYYVRVTGPSGSGYVSELYSGVLCPSYVSSCDLAGATPIGVVAGATTAANVDLQIGASISGTVVAEDTKDPVSGQVWMYDETGAYLTGLNIQSDGTYAFAGLLGGTFQLHTLNTGGIFFDELYDDIPFHYSSAVTGGTPVVTTLGMETAGIDFELRRGGAIEGTLTAATGGTPLAWEYLTAWDGTDYFSGRADGSGVFRFTPLEPGTYRVMTQIGSSSYLNEIYDDIPCLPGSCDIATGTPIVITGAETVTGIDIALTQASTLRGQVTASATGMPIEGVWVSVGEGGAFGASTAADGTYAITARAGTYHLRARHDDYVGQAYGGDYCAYLSCPDDLGTPVVAPAETEVTGLDFALTAGGVVSGTVTALADGSPLANGIFWLYDETGLPIEGAVTEADGSYRIPPVPLGGTYYLNLWLPPSGYFPELWQNLPAPFSTVIEPLAPVLEGQAIRFDAGPAVTIDMDLDDADTVKTLTVAVVVAEAGAGGSVAANVGNIDCGSACSYPYYRTNGAVTLTATPDPGSVFAGWSGDPDCEDGELVMADDRSCTATFALLPPEPPLFADGFESGDLSGWARSVSE